LWQGCIELLKRSGISISGKRAVVLGRSNIVGMPAALLLLVLQIHPWLCTLLMHSAVQLPAQCLAVCCIATELPMASQGCAQDQVRCCGRARMRR
jgi:hypothetical protein